MPKTAKPLKHREIGKDQGYVPKIPDKFVRASMDNSRYVTIDQTKSLSIYSLTTDTKDSKNKNDLDLGHSNQSLPFD